MTAKKILTVCLLVLLMSALLATTVSAAEEGSGLALDSFSVDSLLTGNLGGTFSAIILAVAAVGIVEAFFGYSLLRLELTLGGFGAGAFLGNLLATGILKSILPAGLVTYAVMLVLGVIGALLAFKLFRLALFLGVGFAGFTIIKSVVASMALTPMIATVAAIVAGIILGALALKFMRPIVILVTAISGAFLVSYALSGLLPIPFINVILLAVVFLLGLLVQSRRAKKRR